MTHTPSPIIDDLGDALETIETAIDALIAMAKTAGDPKTVALLNVGWETFLTAWDAYVLEVIAPTIRDLNETTSSEHRHRYGTIAAIAGRISEETQQPPLNPKRISHDADEIRWHAVKGAAQC